MKAFTSFFQTLKDKARQHRQSKAERQKAHLNAGPEVQAQPQAIELTISLHTLFKILFALGLGLLGASFISELQSLLITILVVAFFAMGISPILDRIERYVPRIVAILGVYLLFFGGMAVFLFTVLPVVAEQLIALSQDVRLLVKDGVEWPWLTETLTRFNIDIKGLLAENAQSISEQLQQLGGAAFGLVSTLLQSFFNMSYGLVLLLFVLLEREQLGLFALQLLPSVQRNHISQKLLSVQEKISSWFRGQLILMVSVGLAVYVGLKVLELTLGFPYAATIGLLAGVMELFPFIGVLIAGIVTALIGLNVSWLVAAIGIGWMTFVQFLEGNVLVPMIMKDSTGLSSTAVILSLTAGGTIGTYLGGTPLAILFMILAIPVTASVALFLEQDGAQPAQKTDAPTRPVTGKPEIRTIEIER